MPTATDEIEVHAVAWSEGRDILRSLREQVFIEEQGVPREVEWDGRDGESLHVLARWHGEPVGCGRILPGGKVGRMAVVKPYRRQGIGAALLEELLKVAREAGYSRLYCHAQQHAAPFYRRAGFEPRGGTFEEAGIPHISMHIDLEARDRQAAGGDATRGVSYPSPFNELVLQLAKSANRYFYILSPDLDPRVFDSAELVEALTTLARSGRQAEIRILIGDPAPVVQRGHRLLSLARQLPSKVRIQCLTEHPGWKGETLVIRDRNGLLHNPPDSERNGFYTPDSRAATQRHLEHFHELWRQSEQHVELRKLNL